MSLIKMSFTRIKYYSLAVTPLIVSLSIDSNSVKASNWASSKDSILKRANILHVMHRVADWQLNAWNTSGFEHPKVDWTNAACYTGFYALGNIPGNEKYLTALVNIGNDLNWNTGKSRFFADDYCIAQTYSLLSIRYHDKKMIASFILQADSIVNNPYAESLEWKNNVSKREWAWCDALYMGPPALSYLSAATGDIKYLNTATKLWWKTTEYLYDPAEKLYFRDGSYLNAKENNGKKIFWGRGNGWVLGGLVRIMDNMPANYPDKAKFEKLFKNMSARIASLQQPDGSWHASLLDPQSYPIKETSCTGFYCYALTWGLNHGLLDQKTYWPVVKQAWASLNDCVHPNGMLGYVQPIGAAPDEVTINSTEVYGVGAFLLAGSQLYQYVSQHPTAK